MATLCLLAALRPRPQISQSSAVQCSSYRLALSCSPVPRIVRQRTRCDVRAPRTRGVPGWPHLPPAQAHYPPAPPPPPRPIPVSPVSKPRSHWNFPSPLYPPHPTHDTGPLHHSDLNKPYPGHIFAVAVAGGEGGLLNLLCACSLTASTVSLDSSSERTTCLSLSLLSQRPVADQTASDQVPTGTR